MNLGDIPTEGHLETEWGWFKTKIVVSNPMESKRHWFICKIFWPNDRPQRECCGRGRSPEVAIRFAKRALKRWLLRGK